MGVTYSGLTGTRASQSSIRGWINQDVPADVILDDAQAHIFRRLRVREMIAITTGTITASSTAVALPVRYLSTKRLRVVSPDAYEIQPRLIEDLDDMRSYDGSGGVSLGSPMMFAEAGTAAEFDVASDQAYVYRWTYFQEPARLSTATETNWLTDKAPRLVRAACLAFANEYMKDQAEKVYWLQVAEAEIDRLNEEYDMAQGAAIIDRPTAR
jgi:hypothetical protein